MKHDRDELQDRLAIQGSKLSDPVDWVDKLDTLCTRCSSSQIMRQKGERQYTVYCHNYGQNVPPIEECSSFTEQNQLTLRDMVEIATLIEIKKKAGFTT
jgi:hypothetical protein